MTDYTTREGGTFLKSALGFLKAQTKALRKDPATIHQDFEQDVLERLVALSRGHKGTPIVGVKANPMTGDISVMCQGWDHTMTVPHWRKFTLRFTFPMLSQRKFLGDPNAVAQAAYFILAQDPPK